MQQKQNRKRIAITVALVACLASVAGLGTLAWLTAQDEAVNEFTVGNFSDPDDQPDKDKPENPDPDNPANDNDPYLSGLLTETKWVNKSKVSPSYSIPKNPNVGVGADSDDSYVFVYVKNKMTDDPGDIYAHAPYFTLNENWKAVEGAAHTATENTSAYVDGLFVYKGGKSGAENIFTSNKTEDAASWPVPGHGDKFTGEVFSSVITPTNADLGRYADSPTMEVTAFVYGVQYDANGDPVASGEGSYDAAVAWAKQQAGIN